MLFSDNCEGMPRAEGSKAKSRMRAYNRTGSSKLGLAAPVPVLMKRIFGKKTLAWIEPPILFLLWAAYQNGRLRLRERGLLLHR
jgi:hypothetical protein